MAFKTLNARYALVNAAYFVLLCATIGYAYNFLAGTGLPDGTIGIILAAVNVLSAVGQTVFSDVVDRSSSRDERSFVSVTMVVVVALAVLASLMPGTGAAGLACAVAAITVSTMSTPFLNSMAFAYERNGGHINYGLGRGVGAASYALGGLVLGMLWGMAGRGVFPVFVAVAALLVLVFVRLMPSSVGDACDEAEPVSRISYLAFMGKYRPLMVVVVAIVLVYSCHNLVNVFFAKVIANFLGAEAAAVPGAVEGIQGTTMFIQALVELPAMALSTRLLRRFGVDRILVFSSVMFVVKYALTLVCTSAPMLYAISVLEMPSFALFLPATVHFANRYVLPEDRNKGQSLLGVTSVLGSLVASLAGGQLFQFTGVTTTIAVGVTTCAAGTLLIMFGVRHVAAVMPVASETRQSSR